MERPGIYDLGTATITAAVTDSVITEGVSAAGVAQELIDRLEGMASATLYCEFVYGSGGTTCAVIVQTSINQGSDWIDVCRFDFTTANASKTANLSAEAAAAVAAVAALSVEGKVDGVLGDRLRAKVTSTGTYAGNTSVSVRAAVR
ncbi:hypothetical protein [Allomesorhizobium camelthorni]|uniref:Uncharacterized protein n=1 Tax=Allomesorhizobium camelthorni TaxID=475069 RepID=A0A6G4W6R5_9HYPH|nr:hypothetical protein [Mesorhizobium camelthorni]NGO50432.1 hypothetical protein [Mesorhizobium camelthorni]